MASLPFSLNGRLVLVGLVLIGFAFVGCGGGGRTSNPGLAATITLKASPETVRTGQSVTLTWNSTYVDQVDSSNFGATRVRGSVTAGPIMGPTDYYITCSGPGGKVTATASVTSAAIPPRSLAFVVGSSWEMQRLLYVPIGFEDHPEFEVDVRELPLGSTLLDIDPTGNRGLILMHEPTEPYSAVINEIDLDGPGADVGRQLSRGGQLDAFYTKQGLIVMNTDRGPEIYTADGSLIPSIGHLNTKGIAVNGDGSRAMIGDDFGFSITTFPGLETVATFSSERDFYRPQWNPTYDQIVFNNHPVDGVPSGVLWTIRPDGSNKHQLASNAYSPHFDSTGNNIFFVSPNIGIYVIRFNGSGLDCVREDKRQNVTFLTVL